MCSIFEGILIVLQNPWRDRRSPKAIREFNAFKIFFQSNTKKIHSLSPCAALLFKYSSLTFQKLCTVFNGIIIISLYFYTSILTARGLSVNLMFPRNGHQPKKIEELWQKKIKMMMILTQVLLAQHRIAYL